METIAGLALTGRKLLGPASDLVEAEDESGLRHTCIVYHEEYRTHSAITDAWGVVRGFLESPLVTGLVELVGHDAELGAFVYPTGAVWSLAEVIRIMADSGKAAGVRAGLELMYTAGQILVEGAEAGASQGVYSHGGLTPRRIVVKEDGQVMLIGYALPQVDILHFHEAGGQLPREDSFRYCPPERMEARAEDLSSDLFGLALVGFEFMTGKPVYDGLVNDIRQQAARGEGSRRLFRFREVLPDAVRELLTQTLKPDPYSRFACGEDFLDAIHGLLSSGKIEGQPLIEIMAEVSMGRRRVGQQMESGQTVMVPNDDLMESLETGQDADAQAAPSEGRTWTPGSRRSVRRDRSGGGLEDLIRASRTADPISEMTRSQSGFEHPEPLEQGAEEMSRSQASKWSKVKRSSHRRTPRRTRTEPPDLTPQQSVTPPVLSRSSQSRARGSVPPPPVVPVMEEMDNEEPMESSQPASDVLRDSDDAARLLARIRGQSMTGDDELDEVPVQKASPVPAPEPVEDSSPPTGGGSEAATVMMTKDQLRDAVSEALDEGTPMTQLGTVSIDEGADAAEPRLTVKSNERVRQRVFRVQVEGVKEPASVKLPGKITVAEAVSWLMGNVVPVPFDATGRLVGWYRLEQDGQPLSADDRMSSVDASVPLSLRFVTNATIGVQIEVVRSGSTVRFSSSLGTAVPVVSLVGYLTSWLNLNEGTWGLFLDGKRMPLHQMLADYSVAAGATLQLQPVDEPGSGGKGDG